MRMDGDDRIGVQRCQQSNGSCIRHLIYQTLQTFVNIFHCLILAISHPQFKVIGSTFSTPFYQHIHDSLRTKPSALPEYVYNQDHGWLLPYGTDGVHYEYPQPSWTNLYKHQHSIPLNHCWIYMSRTHPMEPRQQYWSTYPSRQPNCPSRAILYPVLLMM